MATPGVHKHRVSFHSCTILFSRGSERSVVLPAPMQHGKAWSGTKLIFLFTPTAMFSYKAVSQRREKWEENILGPSRKYFLDDWVLKPQTFPVFVSHATTQSTQVVILESSLPHIVFLHFPIQLLMLWGSPPLLSFFCPIVFSFRLWRNNLSALCSLAKGLLYLTFPSYLTHSFEVHGCWLSVRIPRLSCSLLLQFTCYPPKVTVGLWGQFVSNSAFLLEGITLARWRRSHHWSFSSHCLRIT